ncbi:tether containing UBX domain for GLUT4-like isoform X2 [Lineus longissimus]|uniref:tether containing UBX domain for GLUT4-like isoform X2 n=1 Tax=Lineus longissimus TaxID=88925 RepID=UPI002B4EB79A
MAASVQVLCPNGHRQTVKVTPNTKILQILEEVCMKKGFMPPEDYELRHGRTILDVTLSIRFANLVSNAKLELVKSQKSRVETTVVIALQLAAGTRLQNAFSPGITLWDILMHWENQSGSEHQGKLAVTNGDEHPVCIYMRDEVIGEEALKATTLRVLGLTGGKAILRLLHRKVEAETLQEITRQLAADKAKQERLVARSVSLEAMSTETSAASLKCTTVPEESESSSSNQAAKGATELTTDTSPMDTESVSPARKLPKLEPASIMPKLEPEEPMEEEPMEEEEGTSSAPQSNSQRSEISEANRYLDELSSIPGVQVFRPGEPVQLSAEQQRMVNSLAHAIQPHIIQPARPQNGQSAKSRCPQQPPVPFKFPKTTKSQDLYRNEPSAAIANKEDYAPCDRETVVYSHDESVQHDPEYDAELSDDFFEVTVKDLKRMMADRSKALESFDEQPLMTRAMRQSAMEEKFSKYKRVVIRVQFPDKMVLQGLFRPKETVYTVEKFVKEYLEDKSTPFYLYTAPPKCVLKDNSSTLIEAKLAPASVVYFGTVSKKDGKYLSTAITEECSTRYDADNVVLKSLPAEPSETSDSAMAASSKKGGQPKRSKPVPEPVNYPSRDQPRDGQGGDKKMPKWFAAGLKK